MENTRRKFKVTNLVEEQSGKAGFMGYGQGAKVTRKPYDITRFGNGRYCPEPPSVGSSPGHPKKFNRASFKVKVGPAKAEAFGKSSYSF